MGVLGALTRAITTDSTLYHAQKREAPVPARANFDPVDQRGVNVIGEMVRSRMKLLAGALGFGGVMFVLYPAIRPFSDEITFKGAAAFGSMAWGVAHTMAIAGFILLMLGLLGVHRSLLDTPAERLAFRALTVRLVGVGMTLPFYGVEAFAVHDIGQLALQQHDLSLSPGS